MKKILLLITMTWLCSVMMAQGFYGDVIKSESFDNETAFKTFWTTVNDTPGDKVTLKLANPASGSFSEIETGNVTSGYITMAKGEKPMLITTSNNISLKDKSNIAVGFYAKGLPSLFNIFFRLEVSKDAGANWTRVFDSQTESSNGVELTSSWWLYKSFLPAEYDGADVKVRFVLDGTKYAGAKVVDVYFDNFFISERYEVDPIVKGINYSLKNTAPTKAGFQSTEPITIDFVNGGKESITSITLKYQINDGIVVSEVYTPEKAIATGSTEQYTFNQKADLSGLRQSYTIKAWAEIDRDKDMENNQVVGYAENITTGLPYTPQFSRVESGMVKLNPDEWKVTKNGTSPQWTLGSEYGVEHWSIKKGKVATDTYLITRPIHFEAGKTYEMRFDAFTKLTDDNADKFNSLKVYVSNNIGLSNMSEIYTNSSIDDVNAINKFVRFQATSTAPQYFVFHCNSPLTADEFRLRNIYITECYGVDAGISAIVSPVIDKFEYTETETVTVKVRNFGTSSIGSGAITIKMQLCDGSIISETINQAIAVATELDHSFTTKINPSDQSVSQILRVWTELNGDLNADNDLGEYRLESFVTGIPYLPSTDKELLTRWAIEDKNQDKQTFSVFNDISFGGKPVFKYGGSSSFPVLNIPTSNDVISSRPIRMHAGGKYKMSFQTKVDKFSMPLRVDLYKVEGTTKTLVKTINNISVKNTTFKAQEFIFDTDANGIYQIAFVVDTSDLINYKIHCGEFRFTKLFDKDLSIRESLIPGTQVSCYNQFPVGVCVKNEGTQSIDSFKITATSPKIGTIEKSFTTEIASEEMMECYFDEDIKFDGVEDENITFAVIAEGDKDLTNDNITSTIKHIDANTAPYSCILSTAIDYLAVNNNRDNYRFKKLISGGMSTSNGVEYVGSKDVIADDEIVTRCITLESGKIYSLSFSYMIGTAEDVASLDISIYNTASSTKIDIAYLNLINNVTKSDFKTYFTIPTNGDYVVRLKACNKTTSLRLVGNLNITPENTKPDIEVTAITVPEEDKVFTKNEKVTVEFQSVSSPILNSVPFILDVNGVKYYATFPGPLREGIASTIDFDNVDLFTPGEYVLTVTSNINADATQSNNTVTKRIKSLPIINLTMVSIDKPKSGALSAKQEVAITVKNSGKGILTNIPVQCTTEGVATAKSTITGVIPGPLNDGETAQFTFTETVNMYEEKTYNISVTSTITGDINTEDNTIATSVVCSQAPFDAGVVGISSPIDGLLTAAETVTIRVKNYCTVDLFDVPVKVTINKQVITGSVSRIEKQQEVDYTFTQTVDLSTHGMHTIAASTTLDNDINRTNDSFSKEIKSYKIDVGVTDILSPVSGDNMGTEYVKVIVKNFGDVTVNNIPVRYKVSTMPQMGTITTEIAPQATVEYTIPSSYDFSDYKTYTITAYTEYPEDMDNANDQSTKEVTNTKKKVDIAVMAIVSPASGVLTDKESLTITVKNLGEAAISSIPIECDIDGVVTKETITTTLAIGAETNYTFTKTFDMSSVKKYNVKVTAKAVDDANKTNDVIEQVIENLVGISGVENSLLLNIYPNPVKDMLNIVGDYTLLEIYDAAGKLVITANGEAKVDVRNLPNGVYVVKAYQDDCVGTYKVIK